MTYALKSADPDKNEDSISFFADVNAGGTPTRTAYPGGSAEREIVINDVDLTNANPPYTLVRFTLNPDGSVQETPLADNIRSLNFDYWEDYGATIQLKDLAGADIEEIGGVGPYDPAAAGATVPGRIIRSKIRAVTVTLTGMNPQADPTYRHPTDAVARNFRQYELQSTIVGRNLGVKGVPQSNTNPPGAPTLDNVCSGYCGVAVVRWTPAAGTVDTTYTVLWDTEEDGSFTRALPAGSQTHYAIDFTQEDFDTETFFIKVAATNAAGTTISNDTIEVSAKNSTKPAAPGGVGATVGTAAAPIPNQITLTWEAPTTNDPPTATASCSPSGSPLYSGMVGAELRGFRIYRSTNNPFNITDGGVELIYEEDDSGAVTDGDGSWIYVDTAVENCQEY
ncbi:MAG TPA: hypothetical protein VHL59_04035, partial [Thermoanaerobaculia bacterium]|nr:hypothetical protein [Thermoanaerobaculia bacterium]